MASFTDNRFPGFNPYVQQLPVEAMVQVGMEKQQRYEQGIQKIQTSVDNVAGLDVVRDVDKSYLQSKLSQLNNNLKTVAAGDFSNFQLVNSVSGMASQIAKDPNIINAATSTKYYRKGLEDMATYTKEGKGSPSNDWDFKTQAGNWLNSADLSSTFTGDYTPYTDYKKHALELIKALTKNESITDDAFTIDKNGNLVITDALVREKFAGVSSERIQQALLSGLSPADYKQMEIDGRYNYSNMSAQTFSTTINNSYKEKFEAYAQQRIALSNSIDSTKSVAERVKIESQVSSIDKELKSISEEYKGIAGTFANGDAESAKARLNTMNFLKGFSKAFSYTQTSQTIEANPDANMAMRREIKNQERELAVMRLTQEEKHFNLTREDKLKIAEAEAETKGGVYGGLLSGADSKNTPIVTVMDVTQKIGSYKAEISGSDETFIKDNGKDDAWLNQQYKAWKEGKSVKGYIADHFTGTEEKRRQIKSYDVMIKAVKAEAEAQEDDQGRPLGDIYNKIPAGSPTLQLNSPAGAISITPRDFVDFNTKYEELRKVQTSVGASSFSPGMSTVVFLDDKAKKTLSPKELMLYNIAKKRYYNDRDLTPEEQTVDKVRDEYYRTVNIPQNEAISEMKTYANKEITKRVMGSQGARYNMPLENGALRSQLGGILSAIADEAKVPGGWPDSDLDIKALKDIAVDPSFVGNIKVAEGTQFQPTMYEISVLGKDGGTSFRLTPEQKQKLLGNRFETSPEVQAFRPYQEQMDLMGGKTTAYFGGTTTAQNAYLSQEDFPLTADSGYGVSGNIIITERGYSIQLNIYDPVAGRWYEDVDYTSQRLLDKEVVPFMQNLTGARIFEIIHGEPATANDLKRVKETSKNPNNGR